MYKICLQYYAVACSSLDKSTEEKESSFLEKYKAGVELDLVMQLI